MTRFFFYGTLMSGGGRSHVLAGLARPVSPALTQGNLHSVSGGFPALTGGDGIIVGEVWEALDEAFVPQILDRLDAIEGYQEGRESSSMYLREERELLAPVCRAYVYVWNRGMDWLEPIPGGDWRRYRSEPQPERVG